MAIKKNEKRGKDMSIMNLIKRMLDRYREEGKRKMEIEEAVNEAAKKATVAGDHEKRHTYYQSEEKISVKNIRMESEKDTTVYMQSDSGTVTERKKDNAAAVGMEGKQSRIWIDQTTRTGELWITLESSSNNWKKMHGFVMTRRKGK